MIKSNKDKIKYSDLTKRQQYIYNKLDNNLLILSNNEKVLILALLINKYKKKY